MPELLKWTYNLGTWKAESSVKVGGDSSVSKISYHYEIKITEEGRFYTNNCFLKVGPIELDTLGEVKEICESRERQIRKEAKPSPCTAFIECECNDGEWTVFAPGMTADQLDAGEAMILVAALIMTPERREGIINGLSKPK